MNGRGDSLLASHRYFEASLQYERVLFMTDDPAQVYHSVISKVQCLKRQHLFTEAIKFVNANRKNNLPDSLSYTLYYEQILCAYLAGSFENCLATIEQVKLSLPVLSKDVSLDVLQILSLNELRRWNEAALVYTSFLQKTGTIVSEENPYSKIPALKSADKAAWLSTFIPGGGQFYAGKPVEAIISILIQGAGIYYGIWSFREKYYLSAWLAGAGIFGSFHMGGVRRSETLVNQYNQKKSFEFNDSIKKNITGML